MECKIKIMIVEDQAIVATALQIGLTSMGYEVTKPVSSGEEAVKRAKQDKPDLVLMDVFLLGEMDGIEAALEIRSDYDIPLIFLTGYNDEEIFEKINSIESCTYLIKPVDPVEIKAAIEQVLKK